MHGSSLTYAWLSDGTKVAAKADDGSGNGLQKRYVGSFVYTSNGGHSTDSPTEVESIAWDEGRIFFEVPMIADSLAIPDGIEVAVDSVAADSTWVNLYRDCWFAGDHLGNVRTVVDITQDLAAPQILEQSDYLPFGTKIQNTAHASWTSNRWRYAAKEEQRFGSLDLSLLDFGARMYDPFTTRWTAVDPLAYKYADQSAYLYCVDNPSMFFEKEGKDIWTINAGGEVSYLKKSKGDFLYFADNNGTLSSDRIELNNSDILLSLENSCNPTGNRIVFMAQSKSADDIFKVFKFASDHTNVEWVVHRNGAVFTLGSIHNEISSASYEDYGIRKPNASVHSHPDTIPTLNEESMSMGYLSGSVRGDAKKVLLGMSPKYNYVYFPESGRLYNVEIGHPRFIRNVHSYGEFYFGTLNNK